MAVDPSPEHRVEGVPRVVKLLRRLLSAHSLINAQLPGGRASYNTAIIAVTDQEGGHLDLDELSLAEGHRQVCPGMRLRLHARLNGIEVGFSCTVREVNQASDGALYRAALPEYINYHERRAQFRIKLGGATRIPASLRREPPADGELVNLSPAGFALLVHDRDNAAPLERSDEPLPCRIEFTADERLEAQVQVRHAQYNPQARTLLVGCAFTGLDGQRKRLLQRVTFDYQRRMLARLAEMRDDD